MSLFIKLLNLKKKMDQMMVHALVDVHQIDAFRRQHGRGRRALRLFNWIVLCVAIISVVFLFYCFFTSRSGKGRVTAFIDYPWTENDTIVSVSTAVKPIHLIEYVNNTGSAKLMGSGKGRVTAFINNPWTENDTNIAVRNVKTAVKPIHLIEYVNQTQLMMGSGKGGITAFIENPWTENDTIVSVKTAVKPIHLIEYVNQTHLMMESEKGRVTGFIDNPWTENDTTVSVSTAVRPIHLMEYVNNTVSGAANEQSIWFK